MTFDIKSSAEIIQQGETGYMAVPYSVEDMTSMVKELGGDKGLRELMGENGRARVEKDFSFEKNYKVFIELIKLQPD